MLRHTNWGRCKLKFIQFKFNQMQVFEERRKLEYPGVNLSEQRREPRKLNPHMTPSLEIECRSYCWKGRPVAGERQGGRAPPPPEIFRFELNSTTKVEFCLLKLTAFSGSYSFQVLSVTVLMFCAIWSCVKERDRIFPLPKTTNSFKISAYFSSK